MAYSVGDTVTLDGIESLIVYDAGSEQSWGRYLCVDKNHDLSYYTDGFDYYEQSHNFSNWGNYNSITNVTNQEIGDGLSNTNSLLGFDTSTDTIWYDLKSFRTNHSNNWFIPTVNELITVANFRESLNNLTTQLAEYRYYWTSSEIDEYYAYLISVRNSNARDEVKSYSRYRVRLCRYLSDPYKNIQISCSTSQSQIYYTDDNSDPTSSSNLYSSIFQTENGNIIKAIATKEGWDDSNIAILDTSNSTTSTEYIPEITRQSENNKTLTEDSNKNI